MAIPAFNLSLLLGILKCTKQNYCWRYQTAGRRHTTTASLVRAIPWSRPATISDIEIGDLLKAQAKYKERSHKTHYKTHEPELNLFHKSIQLHLGTLFPKSTTEHPTQDIAEPAVSGNPGTKPPQIVLIGDSMLERLKTTGRSVQAKLFNRPNTFNAGVGGDKIENVLYRLQLGLLQLMQPLATRLWIVHIGANNLRPNGPLRPFDLENYCLLLRALFSVSPRHAQILVTGIFRRKDIADAHVHNSNRSIKGIVEEMNKGYGSERILFMEQPNQLTKAHLADKVHLNAEGYRIWDRILSGKIDDLLKSL